MRSFYYSFYRINSQFNDFLAQKIQKEEKSAMRNLKKILALALALVMSMSLMATANAFTDDDSITDTYETAVTVLSGLKVFQGYDDGSFLPQGAITRAEVAAIIYRIVTGDVADTQVGIYADYNKFDDVASTSWYAGYVNFCANAEYIKGYDARTFGPNDPVTGYQALAMILRALGYDKNGEFTGTNWTIQTAAVGEQRGITKNITAGTLGVAATREVVAEILFRAILVNKVNYTPAFGYTEDDTSIGYDTFKLEEIEGVVVANEYADLYDTKPLRAGYTELNVDGESYMIELATTLEDIGEAQAAYITGETVLAIGDAGNTVFETGAEADIDSDSNFEEVTALERDASTEYFVNFDGGNTYEASDYRISYVLEFANGAATVAFEEAYDIDIETLMDETSSGSNSWRKVIRPGNEITADDLTVIEAIFDDADRIDEIGYVMGEVYIGTQSVDDISDEISYREFLDEYVTTGENSKTVDGNENGNWLKVVDNDGDGVADVVMKTIYTGAGVEDIDRDGNIELTVLNTGIASNHYDNLNDLDEDIDVVSADELSEGDVVYYAVIDGNAQTYLAEMVTAEIDSVNRRTLTATTTDGDEYVESDVHDHVGWDGFESGVRNLEDNTSYDLYLDKYGNLMTFVQSATSGDFVLLTNGYFQTGRTEDIYAAMVWDSEAQELVDTDITSGGELFIKHGRDDNDWGNLKNFANINDDGSDVLTIVASLNEDGELVPVEDSTNTRDIRIIATDDNVIPGRDYETGDAYITGTNDRTAYDTIDSTNAEVRALSSTVYYYVYEESGDTIVDEYVGYANLPSLYDDDLALIEDVYVVGTRENRESNLGNATYYTANVVVVEFTRSYRANAEQVFIYDTPVVGNSVKLEDVDMIRADGTIDTVTIDLTKSVGATYDPAGEKRINPGLYYMWATNDEGVYVVERMTAEDIADSRYAVGQVSTSLATMDNDWVEVRQWNVNGETSEYDTYGYVADSSKTYTLDYSVEQYNWNDIWYLEAHMAEADAEDVLDEQVDISLDRDAAQANQDSRYWWNNNDVLIAYNGDGDIIYAVSFNNYDTYTAAEMAYLALRQNVDYAQDVWGSLMAAVPGTTTVSFYGEKAVAGTDADFEATVTYAEAKAAGDNGIAVSYGTIVSGDKTTAVTVGGDIYTGLIQGADGEYYTFKLTQSPARDTTILKSNHSSIVVDPDFDSTYGSITVANRNMSIEEFESHLYTDDGSVPSFKYTNAQGNVTDKSQTLSNVTEIEITVTAEDTTTKQIYLFNSDATTAQLNAAMIAAKALLNRAAEARVNFIISVADVNSLNIDESDKAAILAEMEADLTGYEGQIDNAGTLAALQALIEEQAADADGMIIKGTLADLVKGAGWNAAGRVSAANDAEDDEAAYKETADNYADAFMGQIKAEFAKTTVTWNAGDTVKGEAERVIQGITPTYGSAGNYSYTIEAPTTVDFSGSHGSDTVTFQVSVTATYNGVAGKTVTETITMTVSW